MKLYTVDFNRKACYMEKGYITVEANNIKDAKRIALEILENGGDVMDHDGDVDDLTFIEDCPLDEPEVNINNVEVADMIDGDYEDEYNDTYDYEDCDNRFEDD